MNEYVLKNNDFAFHLNVKNVKHQLYRTAIRIRFAPLSACMYMDYTENQFLKNEPTHPWIWFRYTDIFFIWKASDKELTTFWNE